jgi:hypothetical protein
MFPAEIGAAAPISVRVKASARRPVGESVRRDWLMVWTIASNRDALRLIHVKDNLVTERESNAV